MGKIIGIIAEFNPFHNGHALLIEQGRRAGYTGCVAVMSGNFLQRGQIAIAEKHLRAHAALLGGADLVLELPVAAATSGAQRFARAALGLLSAAGCVDTLCFGSECGDSNALNQLTTILDSPAVTAQMRHYLQQGMGLPKARALAVADLYGAPLAQHLKGPNNMLALEYLRANQQLQTPLQPLTFTRTGAGHNAQSAHGRFASASLIRGRARAGADISAFVPPAAMQLYQNAAAAGQFPTAPDTLHTAMLSALRRMPRAGFALLPELSEGLQDRLYRCVRQARTYAELETLLKTKRYPTARLRRLLLHAFLGITESAAALPPPYLRVLGFNPRGRALLTRMADTATLPVSASLARLREHSAACAQAAALEAAATDQFALALPQPLACGSDYTTPAVFLR